MKIEHKTYSGSTKDFTDTFFARIKPTVDAGVVLENRVKEMQTILADKCGDFGVMLAMHWPRGEHEANIGIPIGNVSPSTGPGLQVMTSMSISLGN